MNHLVYYYSPALFFHHSIKLRIKSILILVLYHLLRKQTQLSYASCCFLFSLINKESKIKGLSHYRPYWLLI